LATVRAGNVVGGGDWSPDRLVPDVMRSLLEARPLMLRYPRSMRAWQHVLDPVFGYLELAERLVQEGKTFEGAWNFGPSQSGDVTVEEIVKELLKLWDGAIEWKHDKDASTQLVEAELLRLDCTKAHTQLG
jgi:CDP-glucose 4,6-dehydratase